MSLAQALTGTDENQKLTSMSNAIRALSMDAVEKANSGHPGMPMGMADVATVLFSKYMTFNPKDPLWPNRDRFVLSAGHGSMLQYALLYLLGYEKMTLDEIKNFRQLHSLAAGHPEVKQDAGIETTTGPLGQGIATAIGMALAERILNAKLGNDLINHKTFVIASDGDMMEGISHEACSLAGHLKLGKLVVLYDDNGISIDGPTSLSFTDNTLKRFEAYGWKTLSVDGHDFDAIDKALDEATSQSELPTLIACKTRIGYGAPTKENSSSVHGSPLGAKELEGAKQKLKWAHNAFEIPENILSDWRDAGKKGEAFHQGWTNTFKGLNPKKKEEFNNFFAVDVKERLATTISNLKKKASASTDKVATRKASGKVLEEIVPVLPNLIGGSADLTGSNITKVNDKIISKANYDGQYIYYGVREHGMAAMMNGMTLHGGIIPYSGTFLSFADYCRPAIRLAALMKQRVIHVMTHDSIGLGEDGPTHQPVEHLASLRAIPNCLVFRPCDLVETAETWEAAILSETAPSVLTLTRQNLEQLRTTHTDENLTLKGGYILREADAAHKVTLFATGSEVEIAVDAKKKLEEKGIGTRVVSVPCLDLLYNQGDAYINSLCGKNTVLGAIEAGIRQGWDALIGKDGVFVGMSTYGESAPYEILYEHFGITSANLVKQIQNKL